ncbi:uncharacterized protein M421DRAFT_116645 [Didymella exigua CBS 183.55]|uniref:Uncharacterized protein n=1 Tax=Didymella exigua CBS 183.55 TaxID=1150837 RepID=A0A6A5S0J8_9PLEO|nr:uncharacterized protein M421DRAFT_116645 [Didymella exigua CBS 183.55]KAF1934245.1 hypothetical protein M421DRAFT_116645 [Didymella exigua CBS 183.55]
MAALESRAVLYPVLPPDTQQRTAGCTSLACIACRCGEGSANCWARPLVAKAPGRQYRPDSSNLPLRLHRPLHHRSPRQSHPIAAARSRSQQHGLCGRHLLAGQIRSFPASALYRRPRTSSRTSSRRGPSRTIPLRTSPRTSPRPNTACTPARPPFLPSRHPWLRARCPP